MSFISSETSKVLASRERLAAYRVRVTAWLADGGHRSLAQRAAGTAFLIRVASAACLYLSQVVLARWMGRFEFGVYVSVWTCVIVIGDILNLGLVSAAQRLIPEYTQRKAFDLLRGFLRASRWFVFLVAILVALLAAFAIRLTVTLLPAYMILPLYFACFALPFYALSNMLDGIARSYDWIGLALAPPYIVRPLLILGIMVGGHVAGVEATAQSAILAAVIATWVACGFQLLVLRHRLGKTVAAGRARSEVKRWADISVPIITVWVFLTLLAYTDILILQYFAEPEVVAVYYVAAKTLALAAFVHFSVGVAVAHRYSELDVRGDRAGLAQFVSDAIRWTFWPSLAAVALLLVLGPGLLLLFGAGYSAGYPLMCILSLGMLARSAVGPAERLLNMLGQQRVCALIYGTAFAVNVAACLILIPLLGAAGAAVATVAAMVVESLLLFLVIRWRLGIHSFIWRWPSAGRAAALTPSSAANESANARIS